MRNKKNTILACKLAEFYESHFSEDFPGGITNAFIQRTYAGHWQRSAGAWSWHLRAIDNQYGTVRDFGSAYSASECLEQNDLIVQDYFMSPNNRADGK